MVKNKVLLILFQEVNLDGNWKKKLNSNMKMLRVPKTTSM